MTFILLASLIPTAAQAGSLGRLFFTPEQRAQLEYRQTHSEAATATTTATAAAAAEEEDAPIPSQLMVNGIVQKHGGRRTVWINGRAQNAGNSDERSPESVAVDVPGKTQPVKVKVGQKLLLDNPPQPKPAPQNSPASDD